jgi:hypothetical protein
VKVEMIKTLPLLTTPLLGATPSVLLIAWGPVMFLQGQDNRGRCLIIAIVHILRHPVDVALFSFLSVQGIRLRF